MSSREIAKLTAKRHADVMRDIRKVLSDLEINERKFASVYVDAKGEERSCFNLPRREVEILLTGYSVPLRAKVIDRLRELEAQQAKRAPAVPQSFAEALRLAAELEEQRAALAMQNEQLSIENEAMSEELNLLTVDEFRALSHLYLAKGQSQKLSHLAKSYCLSKGIEITKQTRFLPSIGCDTKLNVYPREALEHAALVMGLL